MRVLVLNTQVVFTKGGAEIHAASLMDALSRAGHDAELVNIPFKWYPPEKILDNLLACRMLDITESNGVPVDRVIGLRFPAYHIPHPNKVLWILHQHRTAFDLWGKPICDIGCFPDGRIVRDAIARAEKELLPEARAIFANSNNVAQRLERFCGIHSTPLYHPPHGAELFHSGNDDDYLYYPSRISGLKRQGLVLEALARTRQPVRVVFSGSADNPEDLERLKETTKKLGLERRVDWLGRVSHERMLELYANCRAVVFPPLDEDYGYITLEAMLSSKPVITCRDSGGPLEFVRDGESGLVAESEAAPLAEAMDRIWKERTFAVQAGKLGRSLIDELGINWNNVVSKLLA